MPLNFQEIILKLQHFWADRGCVIWQPYYSQVGAGTMNPATSLRVLGPEPWKVAYVEPSVRPDDGRYGDNPNRFQLHYQFQVILKPDPGNPQEIYLQSLEAIGINLREHDIRFVEDNWESPALGAWGLGWEVWLDGQEITQFTYFQQAGGMPLEPVSVEITYGLERIAIALHNVDAAWEIPWSEGVKYGEIRKIEELEHSRYYFDAADVERLHEMYRLYEAEARTALADGLVLPAHDHVLKLSHTFNILDTRGAIGVTERQAFFKNMRNLSRAVAEAYVTQREGMGHPWLTSAEPDPAKAVMNNLGTPPETQADFLLEIGTEELPPADTESAVIQLEERVPVILAGLHLGHGGIKVLSTPRRLVVFIKDLAARQPDREQVFRGPPAERAFDAGGQPTKAAEGFARSKGLSPSDLVVEEMDGGRYVIVRVDEKGQPARDVFAGALSDLISNLKFAKSMRWNETGFAFSRPVRWLLALHGESIVPFEVAGLTAGRVTRSLRFRSPEMVSVSTPSEYLDILAEQGIILDPSSRRKEILKQVKKLAAEVGGTPFEDEGLLEEVGHLIEAPTAMRGEFAETSLRLPSEVLVSVMKKHQRYFPVLDADGRLMPYFITVRNGDDRGKEIVIQGNEHVLRARFADAAFFVGNDRKQKLEDFLPRLDTLTFQATLGSMLDKSRRIEELVVALSPRTGLSAEEEAHAIRAAQLCKADLATSMVVEMTSLQGVMGRYYALDSGEPAAVADAIAEHYYPRFAGDRAPKTLTALTVGIADRLDSLVGLFGAGLAPSGNKDPFGLRRAALGLVQALVDWDLDFDLAASIRSVATRQPIDIAAEVNTAVMEFIVERQRSAMLDAGWRFDVVDAVLSAQGHNPASAVRGVKALSEWVARPDWNLILPAFSRCVRITRSEIEQYQVAPADFGEDAEKLLYGELEKAEAALEISETEPVSAFLEAFLPMIPAVNGFFDTVLVMDEDPKLRSNRLGLLQRISALASSAAEMSRLEGF